MSQSCDLVKGQEKLADIVLCSVWNRSEITDPKMTKAETWEEARKGRLPNVHLIAPCTCIGFEREVRMVDFREVHSLPVSYIRNRAMISRRIRLLPPYREHLSQSFARFFMRVGLPVAIQSFTDNKKR